MPRYLSKGLLITLLVMAVLVASGIVSGAAVSSRLRDGVYQANQRGFQQGASRGLHDGQALGSEVGYQTGSKFGYVNAAGPGASSIAQQPGYYFRYNPTCDEIMSALYASEMDTAQEILDYSRANGIRAAYVRVPIAREATEGRVYLYQLVAFETVDKGLIMVEPLSHRAVTVEVGKSYSRLNGFLPAEFDDTITKVTVVW